MIGVPSVLFNPVLNTSTVLPSRVVNKPSVVSIGDTLSVAALSVSNAVPELVTPSK